MSPEKDPCSGELNVRNAHPTKNRGWPVHGGMHGRVPRKLPQLDDDEKLVAIAAAASRDLATKATIPGEHDIADAKFTAFELKPPCQQGPRLVWPMGSFAAKRSGPNGRHGLEGCKAASQSRIQERRLKARLGRQFLRGCLRSMMQTLDHKLIDNCSKQGNLRSHVRKPMALRLLARIGVSFDEELERFPLETLEAFHAFVAAQLLFFDCLDDVDHFAY